MQKSSKALRGKRRKAKELDDDKSELIFLPTDDLKTVEKIATLEAFVLSNDFLLPLTLFFKSLSRVKMWKYFPVLLGCVEPFTISSEIPHVFTHFDSSAIIIKTERERHWKKKVLITRIES